MGETKLSKAVLYAPMRDGTALGPLSDVLWGILVRCQYQLSPQGLGAPLLRAWKSACVDKHVQHALAGRVADSGASV